MEDLQHLFSSSEYEILEKLGEGGMGIVVKAKMGENFYAIKIISPKVSKDKQFQARFLREMQVVSQLNHPNIVRAVDFGVDIEKDMYFVVLEFIDGKSLGAILNAKRTIPVKFALEITRQVALGLQHSHEHGVVHRDIKPDNLILNHNNQIKITDFGLVKGEKSGGEKGGLLQGKNVTTKNVILGSPSYLAPERTKANAPLDIRSDIYSLGITLYHMLAGRPPFVYDSSIRIIAAHSYEPLPSLKELAPSLSPPVIGLVEKMAEKDPQKRFALPKDVASAIEALLGTNAPKF